MTAAGSGAGRTVTLAPHPTSARAARLHVANLLQAGPLAGLVDTATLLVSEVVTNALLHAGSDIELACAIDHGSLCVKVRDGSTVSPSARPFGPGAMTGRGLGMVELLADEWGVDIDDRGKTVWFLLAGPAVAARQPREPATARSGPHFEVHLVGLPPDLVIATIEYGDAVLREHALLTIGSASDLGPGSDWLTSGLDLGLVLDPAETARAAGRATVDLVVRFPEGAGPAALQRLALADEADRLAEDGELLTPAAVPEIGECRRWLMSQIGLQAEGAPPEAWTMPDPTEPTLPKVQLPKEELGRLDGLTAGTIVADDANRILYVNRAAAVVLGWDADDLVGRRLVTIVPAAMRSAHLAGFTRYLITGDARLLGQRARLPALRGDGTVVDVDITIETGKARGRNVFLATFG